MKTQILTLVLAAGMSFTISAQKSFTEISKSTVEKKAKIPKYTRDKSGQAGSWVEGHKLKKVALVSFFVTMPQDQKKYGNITVTNSVSGFYIKEVANKLYEKSKQSMVDGFKEKGVELLLFEDFTDEQKAILNGANGSSIMELSSRKEVVTSYGTWIETSTIDIGASASGYKNFGTAITLPKDYDLFGLMAKAMGVDAIVVINHQFDLKKGLGYSDFHMNIIGVNPITFDEAIGKAKSKLHKKLITKFYWDGIILTSTMYNMKKPIMLAERKKDDYINESFDGFDAFMKNIILATMTHYEKEAKL